jgi:D-3-phosphoglycerate dehydrogenase
MPTALIVPTVLYQSPGRHADLLREAGFDLKYPEPRDAFNEVETISMLEGCAAVIAGGEAYSERVLAALPDLRVVARAGVGFDMVDLAAATKHRVAVAITPSGNYEAVAEHALTMLFALAKGMVRQDRDVRNGVWSRTVLQPLRGKTLGVVGLGRIGRASALRGAAFRMNVLACEAYPDHDFVKKHGIELVELDELLARSDYVTLHVPLNDETRGLINRDTLAHMKPTAFIVNTARGGLIVEEDLLAALKSGQIAGAGLDVFAQEPTPPHNPLLSLPNVLASPHMAGVDTQSVEDMAVESARNIVDLYQGRWPEAAIVNADLKPDWKW